MKRTIAAVLLCSTAVVACTRIIERPAPVAAQPSVVSTPAIVERTTTPAAPAAGATAPAACTWASQAYSPGGLSCQNHSQFRCNNGTWEQTNVAC